MAHTLTELQTLEKAYAEGARRVRYEDRELTFASGEDLLRRILQLRRELGITSKAPRRHYLSFKKGLDQ